MRRYAPPPPALPGWGPMSSPTHPRPSRGGELRRELLVPGLFAGFFLVKGLLFTLGGLIAFALAVWLWFTFKNSRDRGRVLFEWAAVAVVLLVLSNAGVRAPNVRVTADRKAPAERVTEAKGYLQEVRQGLVNVAEDVKTRLPTFGQPEDKPHKRKEHH
jgi:hypothetical protein